MRLISARSVVQPYLNLKNAKKKPKPRLLVIKESGSIKEFPLNFHLLAEFDLNRNVILLNGGDYNVPTVFQIWIQKDYNRQSPRLEEPVNFTFVKKRR